MTLPTLIEVAIGLALIFFVLATIGSVLAELIAGKCHFRHTLLKQTIARLLEPDVAPKFWAHSLVEPLQAANSESPAYLDGKLFADVVLDLAAGSRSVRPSTATAWEQSILRHLQAKPGPNNDLQDRLLALLRTLPADTTDVTAAFKLAVARFYDAAMERTSGVYRRKMQKVLFLIGLGLAFLLNCDAVRIAYVLHQSPGLREQVAKQADALVNPTPAEQNNPALIESKNEPKKIIAPPESTSGTKALATTKQEEKNPVTETEPEKPKTVTELRQDLLKSNLLQLRDLAKIGFPLGWTGSWTANVMPYGSLHCLVAILAKLVGFLITAFAVCLGAPFWFDLLGRLVKLRSSAGSDAEKKKTPGDPSTPGSSEPSTPTAVNSSAASAAPVPLPTALAALSDPAQAFSPARAYWLAELADQAYGLAPKDILAWCRQHGFSTVKFFEHAATGTQAMFVEGPAVAVLAFRGTESKLDDWLTDANCKFTTDAAHYGPARLHAGFHGAFTALWQDPALVQALAPLAGSRTLLHITGHSLGGALATLAAHRLAKQNPSLVHSVYTYGSPRVGDAIFVKEFDTLFAGRAYRLVNNEDLVTRVPARTMQYDHVGTIIYIDDTGAIQHDIGFWYRFLNFAANAAQDFQQAMKTTLHDHGLRLYCGHLESAARQPKKII